MLLADLLFSNWIDYYETETPHPRKMTYAPCEPCLQEGTAACAHTKEQLPKLATTPKEAETTSAQHTHPNAPFGREKVTHIDKETIPCSRFEKQPLPPAGIELAGCHLQGNRRKF